MLHGLSKRFRKSAFTSSVKEPVVTFHQENLVLTSKYAGMLVLQL